MDFEWFWVSSWKHKSMKNWCWKQHVKIMKIELSCRRELNFWCFGGSKIHQKCIKHQLKKQYFFWWCFSSCFFDFGEFGGQVALKLALKSFSRGFKNDVEKRSRKTHEKETARSRGVMQGCARSGSKNESRGQGVPITKQPKHPRIQQSLQPHNPNNSEPNKQSRGITSLTLCHKGTVADI